MHARLIALFGNERENGGWLHVTTIAHTSIIHGVQIESMKITTMLRRHGFSGRLAIKRRLF
jgi:hypothetical protein